MGFVSLTDNSITQINQGSAEGSRGGNELCCTTAKQNAARRLPCLENEELRVAPFLQRWERGSPITHPSVWVDFRVSSSVPSCSPPLACARGGRDRPGASSLSSASYCKPSCAKKSLKNQNFKQAPKRVSLRSQPLVRLHPVPGHFVHQQTSLSGQSCPFCPAGLAREAFRSPDTHQF